MKKFIYFFIFLPFFLSAQVYTSTQNSEIFGLASPVLLEPDTTVVYMQDYFTELSVIAKIETPSNFISSLSADKKQLTLIAKNSSAVPFLSELKITSAQNTYSILLRKSKKQKIIFQFNPKGKNYSTVAVAGDINGWNPAKSPMQFINGKWEIPLVLNPGKYSYQIVADGKWMLDPNNKDSVENGIGGYNSVLKTGITEKNKLPKILPDFYRGKKDSIIFNSSIVNDSVFIFWNNTRINSFVTVYNNQGFTESYIIKIPAQAQNVQRSFLRAWCSNNYGESNDVLIPLEYGKVITDPAQLTRTDFQKTIMYFMMVDRFKNGDKTNDVKVNDARVLPQANYYGGDLAGIKQKIDDGYFKNLGFNALWISPVLQNPLGAYQEFPQPRRWFTGYHGYWPISLSKVDFRFGTNALFKNLIADAHQNNMNIYLDWIANHVHQEHPLWKQHPEWFTPLILPDGRKNLRLWDEQRLTTWFEPFMPSLDHSQPVVAEAAADSAMYWLKNYNLDGFRHDATKHIETEFWRLLTYKIKTEIEIPQNKPVYQIGETFGSRELIGSYIGSGLLNAQFDFNLYFDERSVFANDTISFERLSSSLFETFNYFGYHHTMGNITGNHDLARFISYASGDLKWNEDDKAAGWNRKIEVTDTTGYNKLKMLEAFIMTIPGIPIVYYGDEIGMPGANDPDNRRMMRFDSLNNYELDVKNNLRQLISLRSSHIALLYGDFTEISKTNNTYSYLRRYFGDMVFVYFNKSKDEKIFSQKIPGQQKGKIPAAYNAKQMSLLENAYKVTVKPYSFAIITFE